MKGVIVFNTVMSDLNYEVFKELNKKENNNNVLIYVDLSNNLTYPDFAIMNITEINHFYGKTLVATCPKTADILYKCPVNAKKAYYIWDLSFLTSAFSFRKVQDMLSDLECFCRSEDHQRILKSLFGVDAKIFKNFEIGIF